MTTLTLQGHQIGEALQFDANGLLTTVEIGRVWFSATDTVTLTLAPSAFGPNGQILGGNGAITSLTVTTASGQVTTFGPSPNGLDVDPDTSKQGADYFYISESPQPGVGGAYAGLQLEKIIVSDSILTAGSLVPYNNGGGYLPSAGTVTNPPPSGLPGGGTDLNDTLRGTAAANLIDGGDGNDAIVSLAGNDTVLGGLGNDIVDGGLGADQLSGGAGNDLLWGGAGRDRLNGDSGNDLLDGGAGIDVLIGGAGGDQFVFGQGDRVLDFNAAQGDQILFHAAWGLELQDVVLSHSGNNTVVSVGAQSITLVGVTAPFDTGNALKLDYVANFDFI